MIKIVWNYSFVYILCKYFAWRDCDKHGKDIFFLLVIVPDVYILIRLQYRKIRLFIMKGKTQKKSVSNKFKCNSHKLQYCYYHIFVWCCLIIIFCRNIVFGWKKGEKWEFRVCRVIKDFLRRFRLKFYFKILSIYLIRDSIIKT